MKNSNINICIASDDNYAPLVATTIASICYNTNRKVKFFCLENNISKFNKKLIDELKIKFTNFDIEYVNIQPVLLDDFAKKISTSKHISADTYSRLFIPDLFKNIDKMIYLDVDLIAMGDIGELYDFDLEGYALAAVSADYGVDKTNWLKNMDMTFGHQYFNAGVLLMNPKKLYEENFLEKILSIAKIYSKNIVLGDQDLLNKYFDKNYLELPWRFNMTTRFIEMELVHKNPSHRELMLSEYKNIIIRHFESSKKPWNSERNECNGNVIKNIRDFWCVASMTPYINWFHNIFVVAKQQRVEGNIEKYIEANCVTKHKKINILKLFGIIPVLNIRRHPDHIQYRLFNFLPVFGVKIKNDGKKYVFRFFDVLTICILKR